jgi:hypothetical protein
MNSVVLGYIRVKTARRVLETLRSEVRVLTRSVSLLINAAGEISV